MTRSFDVAVIGAGLIGASAACHLSAHCKAVLVEQELRPGYHSSGRSASVLLPPYGGPLARALTAASIGSLSQPPIGFSQLPITSPRGALFLAGAGQVSMLDPWASKWVGQREESRSLSPAEAIECVPILNIAGLAAALLLPDVQDIDAAALLQGYLKAHKARGGSLLLDDKVTSIRRVAGTWHIETRSGRISAKTIVNAAGAWADQIADLAGVMRVGLSPTRRTMVVVPAPAGVDVRGWPIVSDVAETFYFKPDAGRLVVSPHDRSVVAAQDIQPEDWDVAVAVDRLEAATNLKVSRVEHQWAGLRTMTPDGEPIIGFQPDVPDFLWAAGFGGFGVQASFAAGRCCEVLICGHAVPTNFSEAGVNLAQLSPRRLVAHG